MSYLLPPKTTALNCLKLSGPIDSKAASSSIGCSITSMEFQNNDVTGTVPSTIYEDFPLLQTANLAHNHLTGQ